MNEQLWRGHWRNKDGRAFASTALALSDMLAWLSCYTLIYPECIHWLQPDGTEPALKNGKEAIRWRTWLRDDVNGTLGSGATFDTREAAQLNADSCTRAFPSATYWIQPELAKAKAEPKAPEKPKLWRVMMAKIRGLDDKTPKDSGCVYATRAQAESRAYAFNLIQQNATAQGIEWRYWAEPVGEAKAESWPDPGKTVIECLESVARDADRDQRIYSAKVVRRGIERIRELEGQQIEPKPEPAPVELEQGTIVRINGHKAKVGVTYSTTMADGTARSVGVDFTPIPPVKVAPPKPYERRWEFSKIVHYTDGSHRVYFEDKTGLTVKVCNHDCLYLAYASANHLNGLDPQKADAEIDAIYAGQK